MEIEIRSGGVDLQEALRAYLQRRMRFRFDRHPELVRKVTVRLTEQDSARSGGRKHCRITAELNPSGEIFVSATAMHLYQAIGGAVERLAAAIQGARTRHRTLARKSETVRQNSGPRAVRKRSGRRNARGRRPLSERSAPVTPASTPS
ncbi:MAG: HPF/RaiA family ribosome-associated protein [Acidobacteria bacterium]|nr:HPF/RaiA family ribosome-associated protein [Acidobacteriota bacterium]MBS1864749.1 HPF/RaiA family ribosome-associated protein [Acidobacteriota bacterium]